MGNCLGTPQEVGGGAAAARPGTPAKLPSKPGTPAAKPGTAGSAVHVQAGGSGAQVAPAPTPAGPPRPDAAKMHQMRKRIAVAAEAISSAADIQIPVIPKTEYAERLIGGQGCWVRRVHGEGEGGELGAQQVWAQLCGPLVSSDPADGWPSTRTSISCCADKAIEGCLLFEQLSLPAKQASGCPLAAAATLLAAAAAALPLVRAGI